VIMATYIVAQYLIVAGYINQSSQHGEENSIN
jgi:hypothetical protein